MEIEVKWAGHPRKSEWFPVGQYVDRISEKDVMESAWISRGD
jgi:hypothetical protein